MSELTSEALNTPPPELCREALASGRIHSAYLITGPAEQSASAARWFARALVCQGAEQPCGDCSACSRSAPREEPELDGAGKKGPLYRHIGDHPDLLWVARGPDDTRVRIGQIRAAQAGLRLRSEGRRVLVVADASWLNAEAQNALLRLLEEPPPETCLLLQAENPASLLATVRSRCQRIVVNPAGQAEPSAEESELRREIAGLPGMGIAEQLDWAESYRGPRARAAEGVAELLRTGCAWLHEQTTQHRVPSGRPSEDLLDAWRVLRQCRKALAQRNANPQMVAERALRALSQIAGG